MDVPAVLNAGILIVDNLDSNVQLLSRMLAGAGYTDVTSTTNPLEAADLHRTNRFDLILLDLDMPVMDGFQVMEELRKVEPDGYLPVLVITAHPDHKLQALKAGARDFIAAPFELAEVLARVSNMLEVRLLHIEMKRYNESLQQRVRERTVELQDSYLQTIFTISRAAEYKDEDTGTHVQRISYYSRELAGRLGMDTQFSDTIFFSSPMHDIGKIGVPDHVLLKKATFTPDEWKVMKRHSAIGADIIGHHRRSAYLRMGAEIALSHHERWDGGGYPNGTRGEAIPLAARIMNICDVYDALRSKRPYKPAFDHSKSMDIIKNGDDRSRPGHFDPAVLSTFTKNCNSFRELYETYAA
jgi:putative two-component system response regulator